MVIEHIQVNKAPKIHSEGPNRPHGHGQINPYVSSPCHIEMFLTGTGQFVPKSEEEVAQRKKIFWEKMQKQKLMTQE